MTPSFWFSFITNVLKLNVYCCNHSGGIALNVWFTTKGMCVKNNTHIYVVQTINNRVIAACDLYCCLLPQCEALRSCCSGFPITTKWCCDHDVKVMPGAAFTKGTCDRCGLLWKGGDVVATFWLALRWMCDLARTGYAQRTTPIYTWHEQAIKEWSWHVISIVACCHSAHMPLELSDRNSMIKGLVKVASKGKPMIW